MCQAFHLGIVGSAHLGPDQGAAAWRLVQMIVAAHQWQQNQPDSPYVHGVVVVSGASPKGGVDIMAARAGHAAGFEVLEYAPAKNQWDGPDGYKARNVLIAARSDVLYRVATRVSNTYGSGWTADYAEKLGKPVFRFYV
jgi:hypothetical protein